MRLRTVSCHDRGWRRVRRGRGFSYLDADGTPLAPEDVERIRSLVIPPAWTDVWICPHPRGHLQAVGTDAAGRRQYLYHPQWRLQRDLEKFERVAAMGELLPRMRRIIRRQMRAPAGDDRCERDRVLAAAIRLLDLGAFRIGSEDPDSDAHGLTTMEVGHVRLSGDVIRFEFVGKSGVDQMVEVEDPDAAAILPTLLRGRRQSDRLVASRVDGAWHPVTATELNQRITELLGERFTAKDFRTWNATATAAVALARPPVATSVRARQRRVREAIAEAADVLGNTAAVARSSYVDPRVIDLYEAGVVLENIPRDQNARDRAVTALLTSGDG